MKRDDRQLLLPLAGEAGVATPPFIAAPSNLAALAWLERKEVWPERRLLLAGEPGSGKTHLLHDWAAANGAAMVRGGALRFPVQSADGGLAIDNADSCSEKTLLHVLNAVHEQKRFVLLTAREPPARWRICLPDLASRLRGIQVAQIEPAEETLLRMMLDKHLSERQLAMPLPLREWFLLNLPRNPAALREAIARLEGASSPGGRVSRELASRVVDQVGQLWQATTP